MPKARIRLELTIPLEEISVNTLIVLFKYILVQLIPQMVSAWLETYQEAKLAKVLGPRWTNSPQKEASWSCPKCGSAHGFHRRGTRPRCLPKTSLGRIEFRLFQVTCQTCGKTFAPCVEDLSLAPYQKSTPEFQERAVEAACQLSFRRSACLVSKGTLTSSISATAIHNWTQDTGEQVHFPVNNPEVSLSRQGDYPPVFLDSTRVKAGQNKRGVALKLGFALTGRSWEGSRPRLEKHPVAFGVDKSWSAVLEPLEKVSPERVVFDGDMSFKNLLGTLWPETPKQRCLWHLSNQLYYPLLRDGIKKAESDHIRTRLTHLLFEIPDRFQAQEAYQALIDELYLEGLEQGASHLLEAQKNVFAFRRFPEGVFSSRSSSEDTQAPLATSPLEREMREINRRTDNGSRWSVLGVKNMINLDLIRRYHDQVWREIWSQPREEYIHKLSVKVQTEMVYSKTNVKTY